MKPVTLAVILASSIPIATDLHAQTAPTTRQGAPLQVAVYPNSAPNSQNAYPKQSPNSDAAAPDAPRYDLTLTADLGGSAYGAQEARGGPTGGMSALMRLGLFEFGPYVQVDTALFYYQHSSSYGLAAGLAYRTPKGMRLDLLGTLSVHSYTGWGGDTTLGDTEYKTNQGGAATLPCAGARLRALYVFPGSPRGHFVLGWQFGFDQDLKREFVQYHDEIGNPTQAWVGGFRWTTGLVIGGAIDIGSST